MDPIQTLGSYFGFRRGGNRVLLIHIGIFVAFGVILPMRRGVSFYDPSLLIAYACLGGLFAAPAAAQPPGNVPLTMWGTYVRILLAVLYGEVMALGMLSTALVIISRSNLGISQGPGLSDVSGGVTFGIALCLALSSLSALLGLRFSPRVARIALRLLFFALAASYFFYGYRLHRLAGPATVVAMALAVACLGLLSRPYYYPQPE